MPGQESNLLSQIELESKHGNGPEGLPKAPHKLRNVTMREIMAYYKPKWLAYMSFLISTVIACSYPVFGLIFGNITFILLENYRDDYLDRRNRWCGFFILFAFAIGLLAYLQKYIFGHLGENLTYTFRKKLFEGILYK
jgi:ABC-type multidrug transport system fused ATPase/permease subunit